MLEINLIRNLTQLKLWEKKFDEFNDVYYWQHRTNGTTSETCPTIEDLIQDSWTYPELSLRCLVGDVNSNSNESSKALEPHYEEEKINMEVLAAVKNILYRRKKHLQR